MHQKARHPHSACKLIVRLSHPEIYNHLTGYFTMVYDQSGAFTSQRWRSYTCATAGINACRIIKNVSANKKLSTQCVLNCVVFECKI